MDACPSHIFKIFKGMEVKPGL